MVFIFFAVRQSMGTMYTKNECPHLKNIYGIMKRGKPLLESIFDPKTHQKTIIMLGMVDHLFQLQL